MARSRLERLEELRGQLERLLDSVEEPRDFAGLSREYRACLAEITELTPKAAEGDAVDEIAQRRASRRAGSSSRQARAERPG